MTNNRTSYARGQRVVGVVTRIHDFGVFVSIEPGLDGYIRRRELDLDPRIDPRVVVAVGDKILLEVIQTETGKLLELSRRNLLPDPWQTIEEHIRRDVVVQCVVSVLTSRGAYVTIAPGVDGYIPLEHLAPWKLDQPESVVFLDDYLEAVVTEIDATNHVLILSVTDRIKSKEKAITLLKNLFSKNVSESLPILDNNSDMNDPTVLWSLGSDQSNEHSRVLIVDDDVEIAGIISDWLSLGGYKVEKAFNLRDAAKKVKSKFFKVIVLDLNLQNDNGLALLPQIPERTQKSSIILMSVPTSIDSQIDQIRKAKVRNVFNKPFSLIDLQKEIYQAISDTTEVIWEPSSLHELDSMRNLLSGTEFTSPISTTEAKIANALDELRQKFGGDLFVLFRRDPVDHSIVIIAISPQMKKFMDLRELRFSPVNDVITSRVPIVENHVAERRARYQKLLDIFDFASCIGVPVGTREETNDALFVFSNREGTFSQTSQKYVFAVSILIGSLLEAGEIEKKIEAINPILIQGELTGRLSHEIRGLQQRITPDLQLLIRKYNTHEIVFQLRKILENIERVNRTLDTLESLRRPSQEEIFDIADSMGQVVDLMRIEAQRVHIEITSTFPSNIPKLRGNRIAFQQVLLNLLLNAIQHIEIMNKKMSYERIGLIEIKTQTTENAIEVRVRDTGPGIHRSLWEKVFNPGFTLRGGSGLGLSISKGLLKSFNASISIEESFILFGTVFLIEIPHKSENKG